MHPNFIAKNNMAVVLSHLLLKTIKSKALENSAWFNGRNIKKTFHNQKELETIWRIVEGKNLPEYVKSMVDASELIEKVFENLAEASMKGEEVESIYIGMLMNGVKMAESMKGDKPEGEVPSKAELEAKIKELEGK